MTDKIHAELGASSCERWWTCPGSVEAIKLAPEEKPSKYAAEGTVAHEIASRILLAKYPEQTIDTAYVQPEVGSIIVCEGHDIEVTDEMYEAISIYVDYVVSVMEKHKVARRNLFIEKNVSIKNPMKKDLFGTTDTGILVPYNKIYVIDYKHGKGNKVEVSENKQLMYYALGFISSLPADTVSELSTIEIVIVQPRCFGGGVSSIEMPIEHLETFYSQLMTHVAAVKPNAPLVAGDHCKTYYCGARGSCKALETFMENKTQIVFKDIKPMSLPDPRLIPLEQKLKILEVKDLMESFMDAVFNDVLVEAETGTPTPGWQLVKGKTNRKWNSEAEQVMQLHFGESAFKRKLVGIGEGEKLIKNSTLKIEDLTEKPEGKNTLAKIGDKRTVQEPRAITAFKNVKTANQAKELDI